MAEKKRTAARSRQAAPRKKKRAVKRRRPSWMQAVARALATPDFRPDSEAAPILKSLRFTKLQRLQLLRWVGYIAVCILSLVLQDVILSRVPILGITTDLPAGVLLLITVMEGSDVGSVFILIASTLYYFSGTAPGAYVVALLTVLGIAATVFRQQIWHRSIGSIVFCAGLALVAYEMSVYAIGIFLGLTRWGRFFAFLFTGLLTSVLLIPMYHVIYKIGQIGGNVWKE